MRPSRDGKRKDGSDDGAGRGTRQGRRRRRRRERRQRAFRQRMDELAVNEPDLFERAEVGEGMDPKRVARFAVFDLGDGKRRLCRFYGSKSETDFDGLDGDDADDADELDEEAADV